MQVREKGTVMPDIVELELLVDGDDHAVDAILSRMPDVQATRARPSRAIDPATAIAIAGGIISLVNGLLDLKKRLTQKAEPERIIVRDIDGRTIDLRNASADEIRAFVAGQATE